MSCTSHRPERTRASSHDGGFDVPYSDPDKARAAGRAAYARLMADPERCEARRKRAADYMRGYYKRTAQHRDGTARRRRVWRENNREWDNLTYSLHRYGITLDQYHAAFERQEEGCAICEDLYSPLVIDHSHITGRFRGLLCQACNSGIGALRDDPNLFSRAAVYVARGIES